MKLTKHFSLEEFTRSETASRLHIPNYPNQQEVKNLKTLCEQILEPLRVYMNEPVRISSGYRCPALNKAVGGVSSSNHVKGNAADIEVRNREHATVMFNYIVTQLAYDECLLETNKRGAIWLHVSYRANGNRHKTNANYRV